MIVGKLMTPKEKTAFVSPDTPLEEAVALMHKVKSSSVVIVDGGKAVGILTKSDLVRAAYIEKVDLSCAVSAVKEAGTLVIVDASESSSLAATRMAERHIHHCIVVDDGVFAGILSSFDIAKDQAITNKCWPWNPEALENLTL